MLRVDCRQRGLAAQALGWMLVVGIMRLATCQLPDDIQRELNQNLAEQARIQAMRAQHQKQLQNRAAGQPAQQGHDPNNYSYQQVSPPIQYSYYQPFGDAAPQQQQQPQPQQQQQPAAGAQQAPAAANAANFDFNNLNFDLPQPQAQVSGQQPAAQPTPAQQQHYTPSFTGVGGLPVMQPIASSRGAGNDVPAGQPPLAPQAQQGPPLTEADFRDITGGENYGAPGGGDFGLGGQSAGSTPSASGNTDTDNTDAQLREFGMPQQQQQAGQRSSAQSPMGGMSIPDFGGFSPLGGNQNSRQRSSSSDPFGFGNLGGGGGGGRQSGRTPTDFDFASQPSGEQPTSPSGSAAAPGSLQGLLGAEFPGLGSGPSQGGNGAGAAGPGADFGGDFIGQQPASSNSRQGNPPNSLQGLLGAGFPGLTGGGGNVDPAGLDQFAGGANNPQQQRNDDGTMDVADMGDKSDQFSGADLGGFEQPSPQNDQDFNLAGASSDQQPSSVPYPDGNPQPVGTLLALTQPQSMSQTRYSALPDKGTYQDYPAYASDGGHSNGVVGVVDNTPPARAAGPGRYGSPSPNALAPEHRSQVSQQNRQFDYGRGPTSSVSETGYHYE